MRRVVWALIVVGFVFVTSIGLAKPARASDNPFVIQSSGAGCTTTAYVRSVRIDITPADGVEAGTLTAISYSPHEPNIVGDISEPPETFGGSTMTSIDLDLRAIPRGMTELTFSATVHWDNLFGNGPADKTVTTSVAVPLCPTHPAAKLISNCDGSVTVSMQNGPNDYANTGGEVQFDVYAATGFHDGQQIHPWWPAQTTSVPAFAAGDITVKADGVTLLHGQYVAKPGCAGYVAANSGGSKPPTPAPSSNPTAGPSPTTDSSPSSAAPAPATVRPEPPAALASSSSAPVLAGAAGTTLVVFGTGALVWSWRRRRRARGST
jgi:hypothetical protein